MDLSLLNLAHSSQTRTAQQANQWGLTRTTQQANHAPSPSEWGMRVGAAYTRTGVLAKGWVKGSAGEIEELGRELGLPLGVSVLGERFSFFSPIWHTPQRSSNGPLCSPLGTKRAVGERWGVHLTRCVP